MKCHATSLSTGKDCGNNAITGARVCRMHGGSAKQVRDAAARRTAEQQAHEALGHLQVDPCDDPLTALSQLAGEVIAWKELLADRVSVLCTVGYAGPVGEQIRADIQVFERALDRCAHILGMIAKLNIDERLVRVREAQVRIISDALTGALTDAGLGDDTRREVTAGVANRLRLVTAG